MGHVSINFVVKTAYASAPILVTVPSKGGAGGKERPVAWAYCLAEVQPGPRSSVAGSRTEIICR